MTDMCFLKNQWYVAATSAEITGKILARTICKEPLVLFRTPDGKVVVFEDRCPHRKAPLSMGVLIDNELRCNYHGARFAADGRCTQIPCQPNIPHDLAVRVLPSIETHALIFVWIGKAAKADPSLIPDFSPNTAPGWGPAHGYHYVKANYQLIIDNILDLTHLPFLHAKTLGGEGMAEAPLQVEIKDDRIETTRLTPNSTSNGIFRMALGGWEGNVDRRSSTVFTPPIYISVQARVQPAGASDMPSTTSHFILNSITPETERSSHYFWSVPRSFALDDDSVTQNMLRFTYAAFDEDQIMIEAQQQRIESDPSDRPLVNFSGDRAGLAARRMLLRMMKEEETVAAE